MGSVQFSGSRSGAPLGSAGPACTPRPPMPADARALAILADDLTGACDAAVAFAVTGNPVRVAIAEAEPDRTAVWALNTGSRDLPVAQAAGRLRRQAARLNQTEVFKKIDSVFRGNTFAEIALSLELFSFDLAVIAPAYPALGRRVADARLLVDGAAEPLDLRARLSAAGASVLPVSTGRSAESLAALMLQVMRQPAGRPAVLCDALNEADLDTVVRAARSLDGRALWIGSGGLAHALAAHMSTTVPAAPQPLPRGATIFFIGSDHAVTEAQVAHLHAETGIPLLDCRTHTAAEHGDLLLSVPPGDTSEDEVLRAVSHLDPARVACLFMTGGDTALHVCRTLGIGSLALEREFAPGVPLGRACGGRFDGAPVILKSGGFGAPELLHNILETFAAPAANSKAAQKGGV